MARHTPSIFSLFSRETENDGLHSSNEQWKIFFAEDDVGKGRTRKLFVVLLRYYVHQQGVTRKRNHKERI